MSINFRLGWWSINPSLRLIGMDDNNFEIWTQAEVARLRQEAQRLTAEANGLQHALERWRSTHGRSGGRPHRAKANGHVPAQLPRGQSKKAWIFEQIQAAGLEGIQRDELVKAILAKFPGNNMNSIRSLIWEIVNVSKLARREGERFYSNEIAAGSEEPTSNHVGA